MALNLAVLYCIRKVAGILVLVFNVQEMVPAFLHLILCELWLLLYAVYYVEPLHPAPNFCKVFFPNNWCLILLNAFSYLLSFLSDIGIMEWTCKRPLAQFTFCERFAFGMSLSVMPSGAVILPLGGLFITDLILLIFFYSHFPCLHSSILKCSVPPQSYLFPPGSLTCAI